MAGSRASKVLFVHGAHLAGWCWLLVMDHLARLGIESRAIDLPLTGYADDVESVRAAIGATRSWASVPSSYVVCADDRAVRPEAQRERAALVGTTVELDTDHSPFFSGAGALADFIADRHRAMAVS